MFSMSIQIFATSATSVSLCHPLTCLSNIGWFPSASVAFCSQLITTVLHLVCIQSTYINVYETQSTFLNFYQPMPNSGNLYQHLLLTINFPQHLSTSLYLHKHISTCVSFCQYSSNCIGIYRFLRLLSTYIDLPPFLSSSLNVHQISVSFENCIYFETIC